MITNNRSLLSRPVVEAFLQKGMITISPFNRRNLGTCSYDVTLGRHFYRECRPYIQGTVYNPYSEESVLRSWGSSFEAKPKGESPDLNIKKLSNILPDDEIIVIDPGETILAHTEEFIGGSCDRITTMMKARSSMRRSHISVCACAGLE